MLTRENRRKKPVWPYTVNVDVANEFGLVSWWPGDPGSGGRILQEISGNSSVRNGTLTSMGATRTSGWTEGLEGGSALAFDGTDDSVKLASAAVSPQPTAALTLSCWINVVAFSQFGMMFSQENAGGTTGWFFALAQATNQFAFRVNGTLTGTIGPTLSTRTWYNPTLTYDGANVRVYLNGLLQNTTAKSGALSYTGVSALSLGGNSAAAANFFNGTIGDWIICNRALSQPQVLSLYDPETRWQLRYKLDRKRFFFGSGAAPAVTYGSIIGDYGYAY